MRNEAFEVLPISDVVVCELSRVAPNESVNAKPQQSHQF
jgi:hypothetical protein